MNLNLCKCGFTPMIRKGKRNEFIITCKYCGQVTSGSTLAEVSEVWNFENVKGADDYEK